MRKMFGATSLLIYCHFFLVIIFFIIGNKPFSPFLLYNVPNELDGNTEAIKFVQILNNICFSTTLMAFPIVFTNYLIFRRNQPIDEKIRLYTLLLIMTLFSVVLLSTSDFYMTMENVFAPNWNRKNFPLVITTCFPSIIIILFFHSIKRLKL
jgi:hypothetical protein